MLIEKSGTAAGRRAANQTIQPLSESDNRPADFKSLSPQFVLRSTKYHQRWQMHSESNNPTNLTIQKSKNPTIQPFKNPTPPKANAQRIQPIGKSENQTRSDSDNRI
ncbi:MAG: hypothetical protein AB8B56_06765 [Crocinitomicaceae bacterium]